MLLIKDTDDIRNIFIYKCSFSLAQEPFLKNPKLIPHSYHYYKAGFYQNY